MHSYENNLFVMKWRGFLYVPSVQAGIESAAVFCDHLRDQPIEEVVVSLKGCFFAEVFDKRDNATYYFTDNSGMHKAYHFDGLVSESLLDIVRQKKIAEKDMSVPSIIEYLLYGYVAFNKTFFSNISKLDYKTIMRIDNDSRVRFMTKTLFPISAKLPENDFLKNLHQFFDSVKHENIVIDLTGGFDTRLLVSVAMKHGLQFSVGTSGVPGHSDVRFAKKLAAQILKRHLVYEHDISNLETDIYAILEESHGELDPISYHRIYNYVRYRKENGATLCVSGAGGEMYTDMFWLQDFPFYWSKKSDIDRLYEIRLKPPAIREHLFEESAVNSIKEIESSTVNGLKAEYQADRNTRTYDNIRYYYWLQSAGSNFLTMNNNYVCYYSPYMEFTNVNFGYHLPRRSRFFHRFHRENITSHCRELAKAKTIYGVTASSHWSDVALDIPRYFCDKVKKYIDWRLERSAVQKRLSRHIDSPLIFTKARDLPESKASLGLFKHLKILKASVSMDDLPDGYIGRILALRKVLKEVPLRQRMYHLFFEFGPGGDLAMDEVLVTFSIF